MKIDIDKLQKSDGTLKLKANTQDYPELQEIGLIGEIKLKADITPIPDKYWINGQISGSMKGECPKCSSALTCIFQIELKILVEFTRKKDLNWDENEDMNFDEYLLQVGQNMQEFSIIEQIREQILLNCDVLSPSSNLTLPECTSCLPIHDEETRLNKESKTDPRWEKLKDLL